ncbi:MAG TPA: PIG-L family deacetylase [Bryobacteraceae bacterium]|nr:PIG-L family deacetylase [Bryobacteraceae bacterium]
MSDTKCVLFVHAHPDDIETLGAGTAALLARRGHRIVLATLTPGDCGSRDYSAEELARIRKREAAAAANLIAAEYHCLEFRDLVIFVDDASRRRVTEFIRRVRPDLVITSAPADYHCDHEATSLLVRDACFAAGAPNYRTGSAEPFGHIPHLYFMDPVEGVDREGNPVPPDFVVNVEKYMDVKRDMLSCHESQREWLRKHHGIDDFVGQMVQWTRAAGERVGIRYGEGFRRYKVAPFPQTSLLPELVGEVVAVMPKPVSAV